MISVDLPGLCLERRGPVGWLIFDRPEAGNAMDAAMMDSLPKAWSSLDEDSDVRAIVVTGRGEAFQTGLDLRQLAREPGALRAMSRRTRSAQPGLTGWHLGVRTPVIVAVNGTCAGGGLHFVVDADIAIASSTSTFVDPHVSVGQTSAYESIGLARRGAFGEAARLALLGAHARTSAERARQVGWVSEVLAPDELLGRAQELGEWIAGSSSQGSADRKAALWRALELPLTEAWSRAEAGT
jgi:enoyl-CoA hydratase/carnithine racemase